MCLFAVMRGGLSCCLRGEGLFDRIVCRARECSDGHVAGLLVTDVGVVKLAG